jgi:hypothetical protein
METPSCNWDKLRVACLYWQTQDNKPSKRTRILNRDVYLLKALAQQLPGMMG